MVCSSTTVKISSVAFNVILALLGLGAIGWIAFHPGASNETSTMLTYVGCALVVLFAILGCFAAIKESMRLAIACAVFLLILVVLQTIATVMEHRQQPTKAAVEKVEAAWNNDAMDALQMDYKCCGKVSPQDYALINKIVPPSCYPDPSAPNSSNLYTDGCIKKLETYESSMRRRFLLVSWVLVAFMFFDFILAIVLAVIFRNKQRRLDF